MPSAPLVSIVIPVYNDEDTIGGALDSCLAQTLQDIEVICVDDASSDASVAVIEAYQTKDPRVRLIRQESNRSAFQARRAGIVAAASEYVLFLDGDDALHESAAQIAQERAITSGADLVGFGVTIVRADGRSGGNFENRLQPRHQRLTGSKVLTGIFPLGEPASGQLWRYLFRAEILRKAYALLPDDLVLPRANDVPLMFLAAAIATSYVSVTDRLYLYSFGTGRSGQRVDDLDQAKFYAGAITAIDSVRPAVDHLAMDHSAPAVLLDAYESVRLSIIGHTCGYLQRHSPPELLPQILNYVSQNASPKDLLVAAARFSRETLTALKANADWIEVGERPVRNILLTTMNLRTGGVTGVLLAQARVFLAAGYNVTVLARRPGNDLSILPAGATFLELTTSHLADRLDEWAEICRSREIDLVIEHQILYTRDWPDYALAARTAGALTIGWIHNFAGRPIYDLKDLHSLMQSNLHLLSTLVVLSPLDVAFWKLRGVSHAVYLPNPPSPLLLDLAKVPMASKKSAPDGRIELVWWGRLEQRTKQVLELVEVARELKARDVDFHLNVVGPDWGTLTATEFNNIARRAGVGDRVRAIGPRHGYDLVKAIDAAHVALSTSVIEGYPLTLAEAQARGLPVFMYDLPWLALAQGNDGIVSVPQGDAAALAEQIKEVTSDPERYLALSNASLKAADQVMSTDFGLLYQQLITGTLPPEASPEPTLANAQKLIDLLIFFSERNAGLLQKPSDAAKKPSPAKKRSTAKKGSSTKKGSTTKKPSARRTTGSRPAPSTELLGSSLAHRAWRTAKPAGRRVLILFPALRPFAHSVKSRLARSR